MNFVIYEQLIRYSKIVRKSQTIDEMQQQHAS